MTLQVTKPSCCLNQTSRERRVRIIYAHIQQMKISHVAIILFATIETAQSFSGVSSPTHHNISMHHTRRRGIILSTRMQPTKLYAKKVELTDDTDKEATEATTSSSTNSETIILVVMIFGIVMLSIGAFMKSFINQTRKINEKKDSQ